MPLSSPLRAACLVALISLASCATTHKDSRMFDETQFAHMKFLEGRWQGTGPDGKPFFEEYSLVDARLFKSSRFSDATYAKRTDGSTVTLKDGVITSAWGEFTWKAILLSSTKACFEPVNAPSSFCWELVDRDNATVTQRWTDAEGKAQSFVLPLSRLAG